MLPSQPPLALITAPPHSPQTGSVSEADYEALVLKLHEIQVGGEAGGGGSGAPAAVAPLPSAVVQASRGPAHPTSPAQRLPA